MPEYVPVTSNYKKKAQDNVLLILKKASPNALTEINRPPPRYAYIITGPGTARAGIYKH